MQSGWQSPDLQEDNVLSKVEGLLEQLAGMFDVATLCFHACPSTQQLIVLWAGPMSCSEVLPCSLVVLQANLYGAKQRQGLAVARICLQRLFRHLSRLR